MNSFSYSLETEVIDTKDKMYQDIYEKSTTDEEREKIMSKCNEVSDWIDEEATFETPVEALESKQKEITGKLIQEPHYIFQSIWIFPPKKIYAFHHLNRKCDNKRAYGLRYFL